MLANLVSIAERMQKRRMIAKGFRQWHVANVTAKQEEIIKKRSQKKINEMQQELVQTMKRLEHISIKEGELNSDITQTKKKLIDN